MNKLLIITMSLFLTACWTSTVPIKPKFPEAPSILLEPVPLLKSLNGKQTQLSDILSNANANYGTYYESREKLLAWQKWYKEQTEIYSSIK